MKDETVSFRCNFSGSLLIGINRGMESTIQGVKTVSRRLPIQAAIIKGVTETSGGESGDMDALGQEWFLHKGDQLSSF